MSDEQALRLDYWVREAERYRTRWNESEDELVQMQLKFDQVLAILSRPTP